MPDSFDGFCSLVIPRFIFATSLDGEREEFRNLLLNVVLYLDSKIYIVTCAGFCYVMVLLLSTSLSVRQVWSSIPGLVKSDAMSPTARHRCDVSS